MNDPPPPPAAGFDPAKLPGSNNGIWAVAQKHKAESRKQKRRSARFILPEWDPH
jgi:hypothetical protein